jgi:hypothetical protein
MPARVTVEAGASKDPRYQLLGAMLGKSRQHAFGCMVEIWEWCTERETDVLQPAIVAVFLESPPERAADMLVASELGELTDKGIRIRGCAGRVEWLAHIREGARKGGKIRANSAMRGKGGRFTKTDQPLNQPGVDRTDQPSTSPSVDQLQRASPASTSPITITTTSTTTNTDIDPGEKKKAPKRRKRSPSVNPSFTRIHRQYFSLFEAEYGVKPSWSGKEAAALAGMLKQHTEDQVAERMRCLYMQPPKYLSPPFTIMTLRGNFDSCIPVARRRDRSNVTGDDLRALADIARIEEEAQ